MSKANIKIKGTTNREYNLDEIVEDNRLNEEKPLIVQVYKYKKNESPNPSNLKQGQIWLSQYVAEE